MSSPKHISGISYVDNNVLKVIFNYSTAFGFDPLGNVEDITSGGTPPTSVVYSYGKVTIKYANYFLHSGGYKTYKILFGSGYTTEINVDYLPVHRQIPTGNFHTGLATDCSQNLNYVQALARPGVQVLTNSYGAVVVTDPGNVFSYTNVWERTDTETAFFEGNYINSVWSANGYAGGKPSGYVSGLQHVRFIAAVNVDNTLLDALGIGDPTSLFADALYSQSSTYPAVAGFDWALNLTSCEISAQYTYDVCIDPGSPAYFETVETDCNGAAISGEVLNGSIPAIFNDGCGCHTDCTSVDATLQITPASVVGTNDGAFLITVSGGTANYTYTLQVPSGISYTGVTNPPATSAATHTFSDIPSTSANGGGIYIITVTDSLNCSRQFEVYMPAIGNPIGCTNAAAVNYDPSATTDDNTCILCNVTTNNLEVGGVDQGYFVTSQSSLVTNASTQTSTDGAIEYVGGANPQVSPFLSGNTYELTIYTTTGNNILPTGSGTPVSGLSSPIHTFSNLATGWYAILIKNTTVPNCLAWSYYYVDYLEEGIDCSDDVQIQFVVDECGVFVVHVSAIPPLEVINTTYSINGVIPPEQNFTQTLEENDIVTVTVEFNEDSNCSSITEAFTVGALNCIPPPPPEVPGCMDVTAVNYNPLATVDNGSCSYIHIGCMDPSAANYNPLATVSDGSCIYGITGCMDPLATNYDPNATIPDNTSCVYACTQTLITSISVLDSGGIEITFTPFITTSYSVTWVNNDTGASITTEDTPTGPSLIDGVYTVTVTDGNGCTEEHTLGVNTIIVEGCMDIYADNYNQAANAPDNSCTYSFVPSPCTPNEIEATKTQLESCLSDKLGVYFNLMKAGRITPCKERVTKVLVLLRYLLSRRDLGCVYNCADSLSPTYSETIQGESCSSKWGDGGPTGESLVWDATTTYVWGDIVQHPTSLDIYTMTYTQGSYTVGSDPETEAGLVFWEYCREPFTFADITNRLNPYITFIRNECKDCGIPGSTPIPEAPINEPSTPDNATEGGSNIEIEDENIEL